MMVFGCACYSTMIVKSGRVVPDRRHSFATNALVLDVGRCGMERDGSGLDGVNQFGDRAARGAGVSR